MEVELAGDPELEKDINPYNLPEVSVMSDNDHLVCRHKITVVHMLISSPMVSAVLRIWICMENH
jgi:hypothetical protein